MEQGIPCPAGSGDGAQAFGEHEDAGDDYREEVIMAVNSGQKNRIGCCYFSARDNTLHVMSDVHHSSLDLLECLKARVQPTVVILPLQATEQMESHFRAPTAAFASASDDSHADGLRLPYRLHHRQTNDFHYEGAKSRLVNLPSEVYGNRRMTFATSVDHEHHEESNGKRNLDHVARYGRFLSISVAIDFESRLSVGCAGAVLAYIARSTSKPELLGDEGMYLALHVSRVEMFGIDDFVFINEDTQASLQILQTESSPNAHSQGPCKGASGGKEGLSIFGLFKRYSRTPHGTQLLRQILSQPSQDLSVINERLDSIAYFTMAENASYVKGLSKDLRQVKNLRAVLSNLKKGISSALNKHSMKSTVWSVLRSAIYHSLRIKDTIGAMSSIDSLKLGRDVLEHFDSSDLTHIGTLINGMIDFEKSEELHRTVVSEGVDLDLDRLRHKYGGMDDMLNQLSRQMASNIPATSGIDRNVIFFPQIGFLISAPMHEVRANDFEQWDPIFSSHDREYFKNTLMHELDANWGDVYASICDKETEIIHELALEVLQHEDLLTRVSDTCGQLDCMIALATGAHEHGLRRPLLVTGNVIDIRGGRHPLQERCVDCFVPNDTFVEGGPGAKASSPSGGLHQMPPTEKLRQSDDTSGAISGPGMLMMTGPNFSGKSVYLKQVAIIVYLAHVGCFVPAERAIIGLTDAILTRVAARDTVSRVQSTFMIDVQQIATALRKATRRSLILIDELGKGTEVSDGIGIAAGVYKFLLRSDVERPKVLAATHFHELFEIAHLTSHPSLAFGFMDVWAEAEPSDGQESIIYLYKMRSGRSNASHGLHCAARNGIDTHIISRAAELGDLAANGEDLVAACATISEVEEEELRQAEDIARDFLALTFEL